MLVTAPAVAQGGAKLAVGPEAGGYLCPDGRQLYVKSCYDNSANASCGIVQMHLPMQNGFQRESSDLRSKILPSVAACKVYPVEFRQDGTVGLVVPKTIAPKAAAPAQTAKTPVAASPARSVTVTDGMAIGHEGVRSSLVRVSPTGAPNIVYVDEASRNATAQADVVTIWYLVVDVDGKSVVAGSPATWTEDVVNCKQRSFVLTSFISLDRKATVLSASKGDKLSSVTKGSIGEAAADIACKPAAPYPGARFASAAIAIEDAFASAKAAAAAKVAAPVAKPAVAKIPPAPKPVKAKIRLPATEIEKTFFLAAKEGRFQGAVNAFIKFPEDRKAVAVELTDEQGMTALHWAAINGNGAGVRWLLDKKADPHLADQKGRTPLKLALDGKHENAMRLLLNAGADARVAMPGHDAELLALTKTDELIAFMIKTAAPAAN